MIFTNPLGLLALLGLPAVILIHFLQRQAKVIPISTLFLLEQTQRESTSGRRFDRLTQSVPLWLQLLMVLLLTWFLVEPRYKKAASTQQVAVVLDSSASMGVFRDSLKSSLSEKLPKLKGLATQLQIYLLESNPDSPVLYSGSDLKEALVALDAWQPTAGALDPTPALRLARSRIRREGLLIYMTDQALADDDILPFEAQLLAIGEPKANLGFTGLAFDSEKNSWLATVKNYSDSIITRNWHVTFADGSQSEARTLKLDANALTTLTGSFPAGTDRLTVHLAPDDFAIDDTLPIMLPQPKTLAFWTSMPSKFKDFEKRFLASFTHLENSPTAAAADLALTAYDPLLPELPETNSIVTINETARSRKYLAGGIIAEQHPLTEGLNWQALQARETVPFTASATDTVLLWQGQRPLILLRETEATEGRPTGARHLIFNFDLTLSNALKLPSTVILLHRFTNDILGAKVAYAALNTETGQPLELAHKAASPLQLLTLKPDTKPLAFAPGSPLQAPNLPGFYTIRQDDAPLLDAAAYFADTREADLRVCSSADRVAPLNTSAINLNSHEDHFWPLWIALTITALLIAWAYTKARQDEPSPAMAQIN